MDKCGVCKKAVTKKSPAITCSKCEIAVHEKTECSGLNSKQRTALHATETLEWVCSACRLSSTRRTSFLSAVEDEDEDEVKFESVSSIDLKKMLDNISKEVHKIVMKELEQIIKSMQHISDKFDEYEENISATSEKIKMLERKQVALKNQCTHIETKMASLEQRVEMGEQSALANSIEIAGIPFQANEDVNKLVKIVANLLQIGTENNTQDEVARRLPARKGKNGAILVQLNNQERKSQWLTAGRIARLTASSVLPHVTGENATESIYIREALTSRTKYILSKAKQELKETKKFKFVWCKYGKVFARKSEMDKTVWIRCDKDIESLTS